MPVNITKIAGVTQSHTAETLQITNISLTNEDVTLMKIEGYFIVSTYVGEEKVKVAEAWDDRPLIFDCTDDPELRSAMEIIQSRMGQKRYEQVMGNLTEATPQDS